jgi:hypothetical protein
LPRYGERWRFRGIVRPAVPRRSGLFTLPENQAVVDPDRLFFLDAGRGNPLTAWCMEQRRKCREILGRGLDDFPEERGLLQALLLGYREDLPGRPAARFRGDRHRAHLRDLGRACGHGDAAAGGHPARLGRARDALVPVADALAGGLYDHHRRGHQRDPRLRDGVVDAGGAVLKRKPDTISALAVAAIAILLVAPAQLGDLGFLLSFTAVAGLLAIQPVIDAGRAAVPARRLAVAGEERPGGRAAARNGAVGGALRFVSVSAWIGTSP